MERTRTVISRTYSLLKEPYDDELKDPLRDPDKAFGDLEEREYRAELELVDRYQAFVAELLRLSLAGIAVFGFLYKITFEAGATIGVASNRQIRAHGPIREEALMIASGQNVKRLLTFGGRRPKKLAQAAALRPPTATGDQISRIREHRWSSSWGPRKAFFNTLERF
jgi:hypothetical protein